MDPLLLLAEWIVVFLLNVVPAFAPPTWAILSFFYIAAPQNIFVLIAVGVTASTAGRYCLAMLSRLFTKKFAKGHKKEEMDFLAKKLSGKPFKKFLFTFLFSLSPLPSNALFIAVGAIGIRLREVLAGFFAGRIISYLFLVFVVGKVFTSLEATVEGTATLWIILIELIGVIAIIAFFLFDWAAFLGKPKKKSGAKWKHKK